jgi:hypothetical protein
MNIIVAEQLCFRPPLPIIYGCKDYRVQRQLFERIDEILRQSGADNQFLEISLRSFLQPQPSQAHHAEDFEQENGPPLTPLDEYGKVTPAWIRHTRRALRVNIARILLDLPFRRMSARLADSPLLQWFCEIGEFGAVRAPSKSTVHRYANWVAGEELRPLINSIITQATMPASTQEPQPLALVEPVDLGSAWLDATCLKANIHYPIDWVLLRDSTRSLMKATLLIRRHGLKERMPQRPEDFLRDMNKLAMEMTHTRRQKNAPKARKQILRTMAKLEKRTRSHAQRHRDALAERWEETDLTKAQAWQIIRRIDAIIEQLPQAVHQARERIIGGRQVASKDKILSLFETEINVVVRGKADAEVEFGNVLWLVEQRQGLLIDWKLHKDPVADNAAQPFTQCLDRVREVTGDRLQELWTDRGMDTAQNRRKLAEHGIFNGLCPKSVDELKEKMKQEHYATGQRRRASTEGRIGLFKNNFLGKPLRSKGFPNRENAVAWAVLTHNLWVLARLPRDENVAKVALAA